MYTAINSKGGREANGHIYCLYFVVLTLLGDYTLLNVFLAIACDSLDQAAALTEAEEAEKEVRNSREHHASVNQYRVTHEIGSWVGIILIWDFPQLIVTVRAHQRGNNPNTMI